MLRTAARQLRRQAADPHRYAPGRRRQTPARVAQPSAFQAQAPVVAVSVAQRQPFRQVVGVGSAQQREAFPPRSEGRNLGVIPAGAVTPIRLVVRQPAGPISGRRGHRVVATT
jgi:hypothetical protein